MTQEEKELLLIDLCARLQCGVKLDFYSEATNSHHICKLIGIEPEGELPIIAKVDWGAFTLGYDHVKPYLRPMSSMTEEERLELSRLSDDKFKFYLYTTKPEIICYEKYNYLEGLKVLDWLDAHHFDYRGLIEKGLALEAPEGMYKSEDEK